MSTLSDTASTAGVYFYDYSQPSRTQREEILSGLKQSPKRIPVQYLYDEVGLALQQEREAQPEYYFERTERALLSKHSEQLVNEAGEHSIVIEYGGGIHARTRVLLDAIKPKAYVPMAISKDGLYDCAIALRQAFPWLEIHATCLDFRHQTRLPQRLNPHAKRIAFLPGSTLGLFAPSEAQAFLQNIRTTVGDDGALLIALDLDKDTPIVEQAYNDAAGATARLNLNALHHLNQLGSGSLNTDHFRHCAQFNSHEQCIDMTLVSQLDQVASVFAERVYLKAGEAILTKRAYTFRPDQFLNDARQAGFLAKHFWTDDEQLVGVFWLEAHQLA